jgi:regulator of replication initiation timing
MGRVFHMTRREQIQKFYQPGFRVCMIIFICGVRASGDECLPYK